MAYSNFLVEGDLGKLLVSMALGTAVGIERELMEKPAGLKTNVLICIGSTLFTILSIKCAGQSVDPTRVAAQIVTGIGFLGAGAIMREGEQVTGLTTAATIWVVAAIGMSVGMGFPTLAALGTLATLSVQILLNRLDIVVDRLRQRQIYRIVSSPEDQAVEAVARIMRSHHVRIIHRKVKKINHLYHSEWCTFATPAQQERVAQELLKSDKVIEVIY